MSERNILNKAQKRFKFAPKPLLPINDVWGQFIFFLNRVLSRPLLCPLFFEYHPLHCMEEQV